jgi:hypothetical protein
MFITSSGIYYTDVPMVSSVYFNVTRCGSVVSQIWIRSVSLPTPPLKTPILKSISELPLLALAFME